MSENSTPPPTDRAAHPALAYQNEPFLNSPDARALRILSEYLEPLSHLRRQRIRDTIVFFGSARIHEDSPLGQYYRDARTLGAMVTTWAKTFRERTYRFVVCSGGGPGIMEAANRGASDARGKNIGLNIGLPFEQFPNPYITRELSFQFHYFFMRKFWFAYMAKALVDWSEFWKEIINFDALVKYGTISADDLNLFHFADTPQAALEILQRTLIEQIEFPEAEVPAISHSVKPEPQETVTLTSETVTNEIS
jgi:predicted Rossmann-fold nucleotide-binding protein